MRRRRGIGAVLLGLVGGLAAASLTSCGGSDSHLAVSLRADGGRQLRPGQVANFTVTVVNRGPGTAADVVVRVDLPASLVFNATTSVPGPTSGVVRTTPQDPVPHSPAPTWGTWTLPAPVTQADGTVRRSELEIGFTVGVSGAPGDYALVPRVFSDSADGDLAGPPLSVAVVAAAQIGVTVTAEQPTVQPGGTVAYRVVVINQGSGQASGLAVLLVLPPGMEFDRTLRIEGNSAQARPDNPQTGSLLVRYGSWIVPAASPAGPGLLTIVLQARCLSGTATGRYTVSGEVTDASGLAVPIPDGAPVVVVAPSPTPRPRSSAGPTPLVSPTASSD